MRSFFKNTKGAVTVFVTLLLIPAMLVSGTAVDLARLHSARSIVQDANQMAANSVLTQYNALLKDIYGVMGVAKDDPILFDLLDEYIRASIFGESRDGKLGTLEIFYGSDLSMGDIYFPDDKNLRDADVLRRQIEEYMKFRGPVVIVKEFLEIFEENTLKEDTEIINDKLEIDEAFGDMYDKYKELYEAILAADKLLSPIYGISGASFGTVSSRLCEIRDDFISLKSVYSEWESTTDTSLQMSQELHYSALLDNIRSRVVGGPTGSGWNGSRWTKSRNDNKSLNALIEDAKKQGDDFKVNFDKILNIAREIDEMNAELRRKIDELEEKVNKCKNTELRNSLMVERYGSPPMTVIERYRSILGYENVAEMAGRFRDGGFDYIDNKFKPMLDGVGYRSKFNEAAGFLSRAELASLSTVPGIAMSASVPASRSKVAVLAGFANESVTYSMPPGFLKFAEHPGGNKEFFDDLKAMMNAPPLDAVKLYDEQEDAEGGDVEKKQRNIIDQLLEFVETIYVGLLNEPLGGRYINDSEAAPLDKMGILDIVGLIPQAIGNPIMGIIQDPLGSVGSAGDYLLLLTYCTSMFSNYTTLKPEKTGKTLDEIKEEDFPKSLTGVPISPNVNYFFQSEWEYLYHGENNAGKNLNSITSLLFLVRIVCNYITVFSVTEVTTIVTAIQTAFAWCPPIGLVLGELARAAFVAGESVIDVAKLRTGHKVPLIKSAARKEWICSPSGIMAALADALKSTAASEDETKKEKGIDYSQYMLFFFLMKALVYVGEEPDAATELAKRTASLIEWNIINYLSGSNANEEKMAEALAAEDRFRLIDMKTDFSITTTVNVRMLFLSLPFARGYIEGSGSGMPGTVPIRVTDYRGY